MTNEQQGERYFMTISSGMVTIEDTETGQTAADFGGPDRLLAATAELNRLNAAEETARTGVTWQAWTPAEFLTEKLSAVARRQRIEGHLAEVREIEASLTSVLAEDAANLKRATALREKLEKELSGPLSSTETAQNAPVRDLGTIEDLIRQGALRAFEPVERDLFKPGPY